MHCNISIQTADFDLAHEYACANRLAGGCGAVVSFVGKVRGHDHAEPLSHLLLTHLPEVTEHEIFCIADTAAARWPLDYVRVIHRVGRLDVGAQIVLVLTASHHRDAAYQANRFIMDYLKTEAPFWKKECFADGRESWVEMKKSDVVQQRTWQQHD